MIKETCTLLYGGLAAAGQYTVEVMVEDFPSSVILSEATPFSTVSLQLSITGLSFLTRFTNAPMNYVFIACQIFTNIHCVTNANVMNNDLF